MPALPKVATLNLLCTELHAEVPCPFEDARHATRKKDLTAGSLADSVSDNTRNTSQHQDLELVFHRRCTKINSQLQDLQVGISSFLDDSLELLQGQTMNQRQPITKEPLPPEIGDMHAKEKINKKGKHAKVYTTMAVSLSDDPISSVNTTFARAPESTRVPVRPSQLRLAGDIGLSSHGTSPSTRNERAHVGSQLAGRISTFISKAVGERIYKKQGFLKRVVHSAQFEITVGMLVISNLVYLATQLRHSATEWGEALFFALFAMELALRICANPRHFLRGRDLWWNVFDTVTVLGTAAELAIHLILASQTDNFVLLRILRLFRVARLVKMLRLRFFRELRLMIYSILCCVKPLVWTVFMMMLVIFTFSIIFVEAATEGLRNMFSSPQKDTLTEGFSTITLSMYALLVSVFGGTDWVGYASALGSVHATYQVLFVTYILFSQLALLNVVTGIFVDSSMNAALNDKQMMIQEEMMRQGVHKKELEKVFLEAGEGNELVKIHQLKQYLEDEQVKAYMRVLDIKYASFDDFVNLLDTNHDGSIGKDEFVKGCLTLKTQQVTDVCTVLRETSQRFEAMWVILLKLQQTLEQQWYHESNQSAQH